ncbi:tetratricopeptide repeat protein [Erythrobacter sp. JK5]|uniref:tetratricopeptide repeat protein n=1 Tax=Erythrobacter sp. JK5 TaxID=2829500 RepID=UPI001BA9C6A7|nr:tetratricopeptide repeat protein [Erythrobacter sp. JK5]QUL38060.1 tetratricopeptide repeat protein [Erythrobacter sp. JK5]
MAKSALALVFFAAIAAFPAAAQVQEGTELAAGNLARGETTSAIASLEIQREASPDDPALLINLGIAYAHMGKDQMARAMFDAALKSDQPIELETADGKATDSRRLARKAMAMLERGEFRASASRVAQRD